MAKLHELLAVEGNLEQQAAKTRAELMNTFEKKRHLFTSKIVTFDPLSADEPSVTEETLELQTWVSKELKWITGILNKSLDASYQVAEANTEARADVVLEDGEKVLLKNVPATALLELEKRMRDLHEFVMAIPTLDPAKNFQPDPNRGEGISRAKTEKKTRTKKISKPLVLYPATDKHPAQVQMVTEDTPIGHLTTDEWSGLITPAEKATLLERVEELTRAIKKARARANEVEVDTRAHKIGATLTKHIFEGYL